MLVCDMTALSKPLGNLSSSGKREWSYLYQLEFFDKLMVGFMRYCSNMIACCDQSHAWDHALLFERYRERLTSEGSGWGIRRGETFTFLFYPSHCHRNDEQVSKHWPTIVHSLLQIPHWVTPDQKFCPLSVRPITWSTVHEMLCGL